MSHNPHSPPLSVSIYSLRSFILPRPNGLIAAAKPSLLRADLFDILQNLKIGPEVLMMEFYFFNDGILLFLLVFLQLYEKRWYIWAFPVVPKNTPQGNTALGGTPKNPWEGSPAAAQRGGGSRGVETRNSSPQFPSTAATHDRKVQVSLTLEWPRTL